MLTRLFPHLHPPPPQTESRQPTATGHPMVEGAVLTSPLYSADPEGAWVRTLSRYYRLANSVDPKDIRRLLRASHAISEEGDPWEDEQA